MPHRTPLTTEVRRRVQRVLKTRDFRGALRSNTGAIDLASIMVGVLVIGVIAGIIAATVFAVIPWSQDKAAKQSLSAVRDAESVAYAQGAEGGAAKYQDKLGLLTNKLIQDSPKIGIATDADGTCYIGVSKSATGKIFFATDKGPEVKELTAAVDPGCLDKPSLTSLTDGVGGLPPVAGGSSLPGTLTAYLDALNTSGVSTVYAVRGTEAVELLAGVNSSEPTAYAGRTFLTTNTASGLQLISTDGVTAKVEATLSATRAPDDGVQEPTTNLAVFNGKLYFGADRGTGAGNELYSFDGTTVALASSIAPGTLGSFAHDLLVYNNELVFGATNGTDSMVYSFNGTTARTIGLIGQGTGPDNIWRGDLFLFNGKLMHNGSTDMVADIYNPTVNRQLWEYDGATGVDRKATNINPTGTYGGNPMNSTIMGGKLYFTAQDAAYGRELFSYDGAAAVVRLTDLRAGTTSGVQSGFGRMAVVGDKLYFASERTATGKEPWVYQDGGSAQLAVDANPGSGSSYPIFLGTLGGKLFLSSAADPGENDQEFGQFDGTALTMLADINPGINNGSYPYPVGTAGPYLYFTASPDGGADVVYTTSGGAPTLVGPKMVKPVFLGATS